MLLDKLSTVKKEKLRDYIYEEVMQSDANREEYTEKLRKFEEQYDGKRKPKVFPWENCSNIKIPFTSSACDAIHARFFNSIFAAEEFWMAQPLSEGAYDEAKEVQNFLRYASNHILDIKGFCKDWFMSSIKLGTGIGKVFWHEEFRYVARRTADGKVDFVPKLRYRGPKVECISMHNFLRPVGYAKVKDMPWCGNRFRLNRIQLEQYENDGYLKDLEKVYRSPDTAVDDVELQRASNVGYEPNTENDSEHGSFEFWELHALWKVSGVYIPILVIMHPATKTLNHVDYYPYNHARWPYISLPFMPREGQLEGIGVCEMLADVQEGLNTMINQNIDNATLANSRVFLVNRSIGWNKSMRFAPGMAIPVNNKDDVVPLAMGDVYSSAYNFVQMVQGYGERRSGLNEYLLGRENSAVGTKATATGTMALIQEGSRRFDFNLLEIREASREIAYQCLELWQQYAESVPYLYEPDEVVDELLNQMSEGGEMQSLWKRFNVPEGIDVREHLMIELSATKASLNKEVEKQNLLALFQIVGGYYQQMLGLVGQISNPQAPPAFVAAAFKVCGSGAELLKRIIETYDIKDTKLFVPNINELQGVIAYGRQLAASQQPGLSGQPGPPGQLGNVGATPAPPPGTGAGVPGGTGDMQRLPRLP